MKKKRNIFLIIALSIFCFTLVYIVSPLDMVPIIPVDDIVIGILGGISSLALSIVGAKKNKQTNDNIYYEDKTSVCKKCGKETTIGYDLCKACSRKRTIKTETGDYVRSLAEKIIFEHLHRKGYNFRYEEKLFLRDENEKFRRLRPDFCIHKGDEKIYIEYWGYGPENIEYTNTKNKKLKLYEKNNITLINMNNTENDRLCEALDEKLANYEINKINY